MNNFNKMEIEQQYNSDHRNGDQPPMYSEKFQNEEFNWNFFFAERFLRSNNLIFASVDDFYKHRSAEKAKDEESDCSIEQLQQSGKAMPVLNVTYGHVTKAFVGCYLKAYICTRPKMGNKFNKDVDKSLFCKVKYTFTWQFKCHIFNFSPDCTDKSKDFEIVMITHKRKGISDFVYKGEKYRWLRNSDFMKGKDKWAHTLQKLSEGMLSMVDEFDNHNKPKVRSEFKDTFFKSLLPNLSKTNPRYLSNQIVGEVSDIREFSFVWNDVSTRFSYSCDIFNHELGGSIPEVPLDAVVFLCMAAVFKKIERDREEREEALSRMKQY